MHATAFSPVLIHTVLEAIKKQMWYAAVDFKLGGPIPSELVFDIADEQTEKWCEHFEEITGSTATSGPCQEGRAQRNRSGEIDPSPSQGTQSRSEEEMNTPTSFFAIVRQVNVQLR